MSSEQDDVCYSLEEVQLLMNLVEEKQHDAELAAELGQVLLEENKKLEAQLKEMEIQVQKLRGGPSESFDSENSYDDAQDESHVKKLERENMEAKEKMSRLVQLCEQTEALSLQKEHELEKAKRELEILKKDKEEVKELQNIIEAQKAALEEAAKTYKENRKSVHKLHQDYQKLATKMESTEDIQKSMNALQVENHQMKSISAKYTKLEKELLNMKARNKELEELLKDKQEMSFVIQQLVDENKSFRIQQEEMLRLLDDAKDAATRLKEQVEECELAKEEITMEAHQKDQMSNERLALLHYFEEHFEEIQTFVENKRKEGFVPISPSERKRRSAVPSMTTQDISRLRSITGQVGKKDAMEKLRGSWGRRTSRSKTMDRGTPNANGLIGNLDSKLQSAENRLRGMDTSLDEKKKREDILDDLNRKLLASKAKLKTILCPYLPFCPRGDICLYNHPPKEKRSASMM